MSTDFAEPRTYDEVGSVDVVVNAGDLVNSGDPLGFEVKNLKPMRLVLLSLKCSAISHCLYLKNAILCVLVYTALELKQ